MTDTPQYPESERMLAVRDQSQAIGEFIDWLESQGLSIRKWVDYSNNGEPRYVWKRPQDKRFQGETPTVSDAIYGDAVDNPDYVEQLSGWARDPRSIEKLLADFFRIDLDKVEQERRAMLDACRKLNAEDSKS